MKLVDKIAEIDARLMQLEKEFGWYALVRAWNGFHRREGWKRFKAKLAKTQRIRSVWAEAFR